MDLKSRAKKLKTDIPALFLALKDGDTPMITSILAMNCGPLSSFLLNFI